MTVVGAVTRGRPTGFTAGGGAVGDGAAATGTPEADRRPATDQAIARQLGISLRTVGRRIQRVQNSLHAETRFQAGVAVGLARSGG
ncbi:hypothetical protein PWY87_07180 [Kribbella solani]|uniref:hypothetical protein n=1 Tax=Kribbella solani TaxID=236067 RepID=UPI0029A8563E|nr:hypothetical protein [Kribbella solani]MDX2969313.1 hypothetical protein [Kribbella solani]MDX3001444.1 hypothetical protein [Kribbella solani]